ncbi:BIR protein [Plasmodium berghei]|uniref:BIR protein n=2 Tax=Plasmodium berghei TaxID=5821 RepID=A0A509AT42_PLABA|nr:BIR protein [Plasmodium berghei ANKA]CXJ30153.1 BIR protein [Plasmodium berghei]SBW38144.1 BIR protein [Plasmodium berghei]SCL81950.1 BIR protein [Plasmodium berghei]SCL84572.1 BIR protein [Plasmodium berghei]SCL85972.1 BIR protein [Plasmodium berghei]|eukprot:XP_034424479.1 BIR protein [Plasmodium berghei ANKA]
MNDDLCQKFDLLRMHLPDELRGTARYEFKKINNYKKYCPSENCNTDLEKITIGFLWLLEHCYSISKDRNYNENNTNTFFLYMISWFSYQLNQIAGNGSTKINDFYTNHVINNRKYDNFTNTAYKFTEIKEFINERKNLLNINIKDMSKFYDAFKLICSMYGNVAKNEKGGILSNNANDFVNKYTELKDGSNIEGTLHSQILSALLTDYDNIKKKCNNIPSLLETKIEQTTVIKSENNFEQTSAQTSRVTSSSPIGNKLFIVLSIFGAIAFFWGISYKYSLFGFRKRAQKQYLREKLKK